VRRTPLAAALGVALLAGLVYLPALQCGFVSWDDPEVLLENRHVRRLDRDSLSWMLTSFHTGNWIPLTWLSHALVFRAAGLDPRAHHLANLLLHAANTGLVLLLSLQILQSARARAAPALPEARELAAAALAAILFGLHPLHVESVAWVAERKDALCAFFFLLSLLAYLSHAGSGRRSPLVLSLGLFVLALLAKPMAVSLPLVLLILDFWPLRRLPGRRSVLFEKLPFLALALASGLVTIAAQAAGGAIAAGERVGLAFRLLNAARSLVLYLVEMLMPVGLLPFHPIADGDRPFTAPLVLCAALVLSATLACLRSGRGPRAWLPAAWAFYVVTLLPVLGILQVGGQSRADRYTYLPSLAPFLLAGVALARLKHAVPVSLALSAALSALTVRQIATWRDSITLWERVAEAYPDASPIVHTNLANAYRTGARLDDAVREYRRALALERHPFTLDGLGITLLDQGRVQEAIAQLEQAVALQPRYAKAHRNLWFAYRRAGREDLAIQSIHRALAADPGYADAWSNLGISLAVHRRLPQAEQAFERALRLDPGNPDFLANLATVYQEQRRFEEAIALYAQACRLNPRQPLYLSNLGNALLTVGRFTDALHAYRRAEAVGGRVDPALLARARAGALALPAPARRIE
jgi:tetratricopeptide (TPR) repeat protein